MRSQSSTEPSTGSATAGGAPARRVPGLLDRLPLRLTVLTLLVVAAVIGFDAGHVVPAGSAAGAAAVSDHDFRMMSWNIQGARLTAAALDGIARRIRADGAEYVGLQEVQQAQAHALAAALGWRYVAWQREHPATPLPDEGIAMISSTPIRGYRHILLQPPGRGRQLQRAEVTVGGTTYHVYNTHLAADDWTAPDLDTDGTNDRDRTEQAQFVVAEIRGLEAGGTAPYFLAGDINSHPGGHTSGAYDALSAVFTDAWLSRNPHGDDADCGRYPGGCGATIPVRGGDKTPIRPRRRLDYLFLEPGRARAVVAAVIPAPDQNTAYAPLSDHFPLAVVLDGRLTPGEK
jgi:endonuclease/exonuclease/phosphatase family metal-dependent hydrolase